MTRSTLRPVPAGVIMIAAFYIFGAVVLIVGMFTNPAGVSRAVADAHGLPPETDRLILPVIAILAFLLAYGLVTISRWGFWLTVAYLSIFGLISVWLLIHDWKQPYIGNATWSILVLVYLNAKRRLFLPT